MSIGTKRKRSTSPPTTNQKHSHSQLCDNVLQTLDHLKSTPNYRKLFYVLASVAYLSSRSETTKRDICKQNPILLKIVKIVPDVVLNTCPQGKSIFELSLVGTGNGPYCPVPTLKESACRVFSVTLSQESVDDQMDLFGELENMEHSIMIQIVVQYFMLFLKQWIEDPQTLLSISKNMLKHKRYNQSIDLGILALKYECSNYSFLENIQSVLLEDISRTLFEISNEIGGQSYHMINNIRSQICYFGDGPLKALVGFWMYFHKDDFQSPEDYTEDQDRSWRSQTITLASLILDKPHLSFNWFVDLYFTLYPFASHNIVKYFHFLKSFRISTKYLNILALSGYKSIALVLAIHLIDGDSHFGETHLCTLSTKLDKWVSSQVIENPEEKSQLIKSMRVYCESSTDPMVVTLFKMCKYLYNKKFLKESIEIFNKIFKKKLYCGTSWASYYNVVMLAIETVIEYNDKKVFTIISNKSLTFVQNGKDSLEIARSLIVLSKKMRSTLISSESVSMLAILFIFKCLTLKPNKLEMELGWFYHICLQHDQMYNTKTVQRLINTATSHLTYSPLLYQLAVVLSKKDTKENALSTALLAFQHSVNEGSESVNERRKVLQLVLGILLQMTDCDNGISLAVTETNLPLLNGTNNIILHYIQILMRLFKEHLLLRGDDKERNAQDLLILLLWVIKYVGLSQAFEYGYHILMYCCKNRVLYPEGLIDLMFGWIEKGNFNEDQEYLYKLKIKVLIYKQKPTHLSLFHIQCFAKSQDWTKLEATLRPLLDKPTTSK